jgi:hypothetical protein
MRSVVPSSWVKRRMEIPRMIQAIKTVYTASLDKTVEAVVFAEETSLISTHLTRYALRSNLLGIISHI